MSPAQILPVLQGKSGAEGQNRTVNTMIFSHVQIGIRTSQTASLRTKMCRRDQERSPGTEIFAQIRTRLTPAPHPALHPLPASGRIGVYTPFP